MEGNLTFARFATRSFYVVRKRNERKSRSGTTTEGTDNTNLVSNPITDIQEQIKVALGEVGEMYSEKAKAQFDRPPTVVAERGKTVMIYFRTEINNDELPVLFNEMDDITN